MNSHVYGCLSLLALWQTGDRATMYPVSHTWAGVISSSPLDTELDKGKKMDGLMLKLIFITWMSCSSIFVESATNEDVAS